jgi:hypothetical protein
VLVVTPEVSKHRHLALALPGSLSLLEQDEHARRTRLVRLIHRLAIFAALNGHGQEMQRLISVRAQPAGPGI